MAKKKIRKAPKPPNYKGRVRQFTLGSGLPTIKAILKELDEYRDVLMGRQDPPLQKGVMTLMEVAEGYFSRACEIEQMIYTGIKEGRLIGKAKTDYNALRTQEIRSFKEMTKSAAELGSRRITFENLRFQQETRGRESM